LAPCAEFPGSTMNDSGVDGTVSDQKIWIRRWVANQKSG
jgi:hypothetical protein